MKPNACKNMGKETIKLKDESGDRKYYTQIPNMIINHSTAYEQSLYLIMKRIAGENGSCFASLNYLAEKMGVNRKTVAKNIDKLSKRKWIIEIEPVKVRGGKVRQFKITDLWPLNIKEYESGAKKDIVKVGLLFPKVGLKRTQGGAVVDTKKNQEEYTKKNIVAKQALPINDLIELFKPINPLYERFFKNKTERASLENLVKKFGKEKVESMIKVLPKIFGKLYAPRITSPFQLERKLADLIAYLETEKNSQKTIFKI